MKGKNIMVVGFTAMALGIVFIVVGVSIGVSDSIVPSIYNTCDTIEYRILKGNPNTIFIKVTNCSIKTDF